MSSHQITSTGLDERARTEILFPAYELLD